MDLSAHAAATWSVSSSVLMTKAPKPRAARDPISAPMRRAFGRAFRAARLEAGITQAEIAARTDTDRGHIGRVENGKANVTVETMAELAKAVGLELQVVLAPPASRKRKK